MVEITSELIRAIREKTGAGMMDCKKALVESEGNFEEAVDWLRKKGLASAANKAGRTASDGAICVVSPNDGLAVVVEINSETDFVAKNAKFQAFARGVGGLAARSADTSLDAFLEQKMPEYEESGNPTAANQTVREATANLVASIGENITIRRLAHCGASNGVVATYIHGTIAPQLGKIGVLVELESSGPHDKLLEFGKKLAMHIAAANPLFTKIEDVPETVLAREREILKEQVKDQGKPQTVVDMMVDGRIRKFFEETVLLEQVYVIDGKKKVSESVAAFSKEIGAPVSVKRFVKFVLGETTSAVQSA
ncbi:MAG: translation elongation factor Ts [Holosporales bacterium]|jgi:elongation factor Ts|nr:translation elongation factor Ts [Holosporales bacterium]